MMNHALGTSSCRTRQSAQGGGFAGDIENLYQIPPHAAYGQHQAALQHVHAASSPYNDHHHQQQQHQNSSGVGEWKIVGLLCVCSCCLFGLVVGLTVVVGLAVSGNLPTAAPGLTLPYSNPTTASSTAAASQFAGLDLPSAEAASQLMRRFAALQQPPPGALAEDEQDPTAGGGDQSTLTLSRAKELFPEWSVGDEYAKGDGEGASQASQPSHLGQPRDWDADRALRDVVLAVSILAAHRGVVLAPPPPP